MQITVARNFLGSFEKCGSYREKAPRCWPSEGAHATTYKEGEVVKGLCSSAAIVFCVDSCSIEEPL